jgi:hypothetical protein
MDSSFIVPAVILGIAVLGLWLGLRDHEDDEEPDMWKVDDMALGCPYCGRTDGSPGHTCPGCGALVGEA